MENSNSNISELDNNQEPNLNNTNEDNHQQPNLTDLRFEDQEITENQNIKQRKCKFNSEKCHRIGRPIFFACLVIAIIVLFFLQHRTARNSQLTVTEIDVPKGPNDIAYINMDTINAHCELFKLLKTDLEKETAQKAAVLGNKQKAWQTKVQNYQQNVQSGSLSQAQMQNAEQSLQQEQQALMELSEQYRNDLDAKQSAIMLQVYDSIQVSVKRINAKTFKAKFVLSYQYGSGVLYADKNF